MQHRFKFLGITIIPKKFLSFLNPLFFVFFILEYFSCNCDIENNKTRYRIYSCLLILVYTLVCLILTTA